MASESKLNKLPVVRVGTTGCFASPDPMRLSVSKRYIHKALTGIFTPNTIDGTTLGYRYILCRLYRSGGAMFGNECR